MPLYLHKDGDARWVVPGRDADRHIPGDPAWRRITYDALDVIRDAADPAKTAEAVWKAADLPTEAIHDA